MSRINEQLALRALGAVSKGDEDLVADEVVHPEYHNHEAAADRIGGPEGFKETARRVRAAFADLRIEPLDVIASRDKVVVRVTFSGRHVGPFAGMAATGREFSVQHIHIFRVLDGKLVEHWANRDDAGAMRQLGLLPIVSADAKAA